jgi:nucleotide-binding universal stress UspA family protein
MKLLVTTDFSANSKGAIRFAQNLAKQSKNVEVVFYHAIHIMKPTLWSDVYFEGYKKEEIVRLSGKLEKFIYSVIGKDNVAFADMKFVVDNCISTEKDIIQYAEKGKIDYICIASRGGGVLRKIMGTHTAYLVKNSTVPVLVVPSHYRAKALKSATYISDFLNLKNELEKVSRFTKELSLMVDLLHYSSFTFDKNKYDKNKELLRTKEFEHINLNLLNNVLELPLVEKVAAYLKRSKPEMLIMFTNRERGFFERIFLPSKSAELASSTKIPMLIFSK